MSEDRLVVAEAGAVALLIMAEGAQGAGATRKTVPRHHAGDEGPRRLLVAAPPLRELRRRQRLLLAALAGRWTCRR